MSGINDRDQHSGQWVNVQNMPRLDAPWATHIRYLWESCRYRVEALRLKHGGKAEEFRIPCKHGAVYPVGDGKWGWCGESPIIAGKIKALLGAQATGPWVVPLDLVGAQEQVIWFPQGRLDEVLGVTRARRRRTPNGANNARSET